MLPSIRSSEASKERPLAMMRLISARHVSIGLGGGDAAFGDAGGGGGGFGAPPGGTHLICPPASNAAELAAPASISSVTSCPRRNLMLPNVSARLAHNFQFGCGGVIVVEKTSSS
jgi:hypothetical protein